MIDCFFVCRMFWTRHAAVGTSSYDSSLGTATIGSSSCSYLLLFFYQKRYDTVVCTILHTLIIFSLTHLTPTSLYLPLPPSLPPFLALLPPSPTHPSPLTRSSSFPPSIPLLTLSLPRSLPLSPTSLTLTLSPSLPLSLSLYLSLPLPLYYCCFS